MKRKKESYVTILIWVNFKKGLNAYFDATDNKSSKIVACFDVEKLDDDEEYKRLTCKIDFLNLQFYYF